MTIEGECLSNTLSWQYFRLLSEHGRYLIISHQHTDAIRIFDLEDQVEQILPLSLDGTRRLFNLSFNHDYSRLVAVTTTDNINPDVSGEIMQWSFPNLSPLMSIPDVGLMFLNRRSYMPVDASPLAFSSDGLLLAHVNGHGEVVIVNTESGQIIHTLERLSFDAEGAERWGNTGDEPTQFHFTPDGLGIVIQYTGGLAHFRCEDAPLSMPVEDTTVTLDGPTRIYVGQNARFTASQTGFDQIHGYAFYIDGEHITRPSTGHQIGWTFQHPGRYEVTVQVIDGLSTNTASIWIEVE